MSHAEGGAAPSAGGLTLRGYLSRRIGTLSILTLLVSCTGELGGWFLWAELTGHFHVQYMFAATFLLSVSLLLRKWRWVVVCGASVLLNVIYLWPYLVPQPDVPIQAETALTIYLANVHSANTNVHAILDGIAENDPDVVILQEVSPRWMAELAALTNTYPIVYEEAHHEGNFGIALWSRLPLEEVQVRDIGPASVPSIHCKVLMRDGSRVSLMATHPVPPIRASYYRMRNEQLASVATWLNEQPGARVLVGDLNMTMWSPFFRELEADTNMLSTRRGRGILPSWPHGRLLLAPLRIPIDHVLISSELACTSFRMLDPTGSDHLPLVVEIGRRTAEKN